MCDKLITEDYETQELYDFQEKIRKYFEENNLYLGINDQQKVGLNIFTQKMKNTKHKENKNTKNNNDFGSELENNDQLEKLFQLESYIKGAKCTQNPNDMYSLDFT